MLVRGNRIEKISTDGIQIDNIANAITIDGGGRTLMPGLIDVHWHVMLVRPNPVEAMASDIGYLNLLAGAEATATLHARLHHHPRYGEARLRFETGDRRRSPAGTAHLPFRRRDHDYRRCMEISVRFQTYQGEPERYPALRRRALSCTR